MKRYTSLTRRDAKRLRRRLKRPEPVPRPESLQQAAVRLVRTGKCSPAILGYRKTPQNPTESNNARRAS